MSSWVESVLKQIEADYESGQITKSEYLEALKDLQAEEEEYAHREYYDDYFN